MTKTSKLDQVLDGALSSLDLVIQEIIKKRFGLTGSAPMSYATLAQFLTDALPAEVKLDLASKVSKDRDDAQISEEDVKWLEQQGLRQLSRRQPKLPLKNSVSEAPPKLISKADLTQVVKNLPQKPEIRQPFLKRRLSRVLFRA